MGGRGGGVELVFILLFWPEDPELPESILELHLVHCFPSGRIKNKGNLVQEKRKLAKMVWSGSLDPQPLALAPCFVDNDYVTAEITYSTAQAHHEVLAWSPVLRMVQICELHLQSGEYYCCITAVSVGSVMREENVRCQLLRLLHQL